MQEPLFSVIICTYQRYAFLEKALASIDAQTCPKELFDVWIMDNSPASEEGSRFFCLHDDHPGWNFVQLDQPGLSHARNAGVALSKGKFILFLDDDATADPNWILAYQKAFEKAGPDVLAMGGRIVPHFETERPSWLADPLLTFLSIADWGPDLIELTDDRTPMGANMALRREAFDVGGIFPEYLGRQGHEGANLLSGEEEALFRKLRELKAKIFYAPDAKVTHFIPTNRLRQDWFRRRFVWQGLSNQLGHPLAQEYDLPLWSHIVGYLRNVPPEESFLMGLCWDTQDPLIFCQQLDSLSYLVQLLSARGDLAPELKERLASGKKQGA